MPFIVLNYVIHIRLARKSRNFASVKQKLLLMKEDDIKEIKRILYAIEWILSCIALIVAVQGLQVLLK